MNSFLGFVSKMSSRQISKKYFFNFALRTVLFRFCAFFVRVFYTCNTVGIQNPEVFGFPMVDFVRISNGVQSLNGGNFSGFCGTYFSYLWYRPFKI